MVAATLPDMTTLHNETTGQHCIWHRNTDKASFTLQTRERSGLCSSCSTAGVVAICSEKLFEICVHVFVSCEFSICPESEHK
jgi:hypothetical protein